MQVWAVGHATTQGFDGHVDAQDGLTGGARVSRQRAHIRPPQHASVT
jgi:hypothetical protein